MRRPSELRRWWTVYAPDGARLTDVHLTARAIRETLPNAVIDLVVGSVRLLPAPVPGAFGGPVWRDEDREEDTHCLDDH